MYAKHKNLVTSFFMLNLMEINVLLTLFVVDFVDAVL